MEKYIIQKNFIFLISFILLGCSDDISVVNSLDTIETNKHYVSNRLPLQPSKLIKIPVGSIKPKGWLLEYFNRQKKGLTGRLGEISAWLDKKDNAWLSKSGKGKWGWEEVPYWLKGYANIGYITEDKEMIQEAKIWIEAALDSQRENGFFGPNFAWESYISDEDRNNELEIEKRKAIDFWPNMRFEYMKIRSFLRAIPLCQRRIHISQQMLSYVEFSYLFKKSQNLIFHFNHSRWFPRGPWGPGDPQIFIFIEFLQKSKIF